MHNLKASSSVSTTQTTCNLLLIAYGYKTATLPGPGSDLLFSRGSTFLQ